MTVTAMEILGGGGEFLATLELDRQTADALAEYARRRWPVGRRKALMAEFGLADEEARSIVEGRPSKRVIDKIWKHPRGGWNVAIPVIGAVIGHGVEDFLREERRKHVELARRSGALVRDLRALPSVHSDIRAELPAEEVERRTSLRR
jgi:hypothetical protein